MSEDKDLAIAAMQFQMELLLDRGIDVLARTFRIVGDIDDNMFSYVDTCVSLLEQQSKKAIKIRIVSNGGAVHSALAIISRLEASPCKIITEAYGTVQSAATLILASGDKRRMARSTVFMHHEGSVAVEDTITNTIHAIEQMKREERLWAGLMAKCSNQSSDFWLTAGRGGKDLFLTAEECLEFCVVDEIF